MREVPQHLVEYWLGETDREYILLFINLHLGSDTHVQNLRRDINANIGWKLTNMKKGGFAANPNHGYWRLTPKGEEIKSRLLDTTGALEPIRANFIASMVDSASGESFNNWRRLSDARAKRKLQVRGFFKDTQVSWSIGFPLSPTTIVTLVRDLVHLTQPSLGEIEAMDSEMYDWILAMDQAFRRRNQM